MNLIKQTAFVGALGVDTIATITAAQAVMLKQAGFSFVVRYLGGLQAPELTDIMAAGLGLMTVGYSRGIGWLPTGPMGTADGTTALRDIKALGLPAGVTTWCDLEGPSGAAADSIAYTQAWGAELWADGYTPGLYVGAGVPLSSAQLYDLESIHAYWHSCSEAPDVATCGYMMTQLVPPDLQRCGLEVDINVIQQDRSGRLPVWTIAAPL